MIRANTFLPELSHIDESQELAVFITVDGRVGCVFELPIIDVEAIDAEGRVSALESLVKAMPDGLILRVLLRSRSGTEVEADTFRSSAVGKLGFVRKSVTFSIESTSSGDPLSLRSIVTLIRRRKGALSAAIDDLRRAIPRHEIEQLKACALSSEETAKLFERPHSIVAKHAQGVDSGDLVTGVIRLYKPGSRAIDETTLARLLDNLPIPFQVAVSLRKIPKARADFRLRSQLARGQSSSSDITAGFKQEATEKALKETALFGAGLCEMEWILLIAREDEARLRADLEQARSILSGLGDAMIETVGSVPSYVASHLGSSQHFTFLEDDRAAPLYLPALGFGENARLAEAQSRTLLLHRLDGSLHVYDHFSPRFLAYNAVICGKTGSGKSVLANALSSALMQDPNVRMIKVDVGGSYKKECEVFGGTEINFRLDAPSGINPFAILRDLSSSNEAVEILSEFLATLIREEDERQIPKTLRAQIEEALKEYTAKLRSKKGNTKPSIDDFIAGLPDFPRKALLSRWASGGVFENALKEAPISALNGATSRYRYFNFENIQAASSRDFAEGVMAAVITMTNLEMLRLGDRSKGQHGARLVLFCDETKFFIEKFAQFFLLTAANFRKFGHGLIFMLQNIRNAEVRTSDGVLDRGLILNSPIRFFLQADTEAEYLKEQFQFDEEHLRAVVTNPYRGREYREAVLQDDTGTRVVRLYLTDEEYWRMTSTKEDVDKFNRLRDAVPGLSIEEAIRCLSVGIGR